MKRLKLLVWLLFLGGSSISQNLKIWRSTNGTFANTDFENTGSTSWVNSKKNLSYELYSREDAYTIILRDVKMDKFIRLTRDKVFYSADLSSWEEKGSGEWQTEFPLGLQPDRSSILYGEEVTIQASGAAVLSPDDYWVLTVEYENRALQSYRSQVFPFRIKPYGTGRYFLTSSKSEARSTNPVTIQVDTSSYLPAKVNAPTALCINHNARITLTGGRLGKNANWSITSNKPQLYPEIRTVQNSFEIPIKESAEFYLTFLTNGKPSNQKISFSIQSHGYSKAPSGLQAEALLCNNRQYTLKLIGGELGAGASWIWTTNVGEFSTTVPELSLLITGSQVITVSSRNECPAPQPMKHQVSTIEDSYNIKHSSILYEIVNEKRNQLLLKTNANIDNNQTKICWVRTKNNKIISKKVVLKKIKIRKNTEITAIISTSCGNTNLRFSGQTYLASIPLKEKAVRQKKQTSPSPKSQQRKTGSGEKKPKTQNPQNNKKIEPTERKIFAEISTGFNNRVGIIGLNLNYHPSKKIALSAGLGISTWGRKTNLELKFFTRTPYKGLAIAVGYTGNRGNKEWTTSLETTAGIEENVNLYLLPVRNLYGCLYFYGKKQENPSKLNSYWFINYSYKVSGDFYKQISGNPITESSHDLLNSTRPGGIALGIGCGINF